RARATDRGARQVRLAAEERGEALARLLSSALLRGRHVDWDAQEHAGLPGVSFLAPDPTVGLELGGEIGDLRGPEPDEDGQPEPRGDRERLLARGRHADGRMRALVGARRHRRVVDAVELALVAERLALPGLADDLERLAEARLALGVGNAVGVVGAHD